MRTQFQIYEDLVKEAGLYGQAFYGHKATKAQQKVLRKLHNRSIHEWKTGKEATDNFLKSLKKEVQDG